MSSLDDVRSRSAGWNVTVMSLKPLAANVPRLSARGSRAIFVRGPRNRRRWTDKAAGWMRGLRGTKRYVRMPVQAAGQAGRMRYSLGVIGAVVRGREDLGMVGLEKKHRLCRVLCSSDEPKKDVAP